MQIDISGLRQGEMLALKSLIDCGYGATVGEVITYLVRRELDDLRRCGVIDKIERRG